MVVKSFEELRKHVGHGAYIYMITSMITGDVGLQIVCKGEGATRTILAEAVKGTPQFHKIYPHRVHKLEVACYGIKGKEPANIAIECITCNEVLVDYDRPDRKKEK